MPRPMDGQKDVLDDIVDVIGKNTLPACENLDERHTLPQQRFISCLIAGLRSRHLGRTAQIIGAPVLRVGLYHAKLSNTAVVRGHEGKLRRKQPSVAGERHHVRLKPACH
jgi:hypothetical protein